MGNSPLAISGPREALTPSLPELPLKFPSALGLAVTGLQKSLGKTQIDSEKKLQGEPEGG